MSDAKDPVASATVTQSAAGIIAEEGFVPRCPHCDYILIGLTVERCPECGRRFSLAQLRAMHLRRRPTPWEDPAYQGGFARRCVATWRRMLRPPFFLFLARPRSPSRAIRFAAATLLLVCVCWTGVALVEWAWFASGRRGSYVILYDFFGMTTGRTGTSFGGPRAYALGPADRIAIVGLAASGLVYVLMTYLFLVLLLRGGLALLGTASPVARNRAVVKQIVAYLSCWYLAGLAIVALGILARVPLRELLPLLWVPPDFVFIVIGLAELMLLTVWCCHADAAVRDGLDGKSRLFGPILILIILPVSLMLGGTLAWALVWGLAGRL
ncbi:MAG TPA: hypothetical protein PLC79_01020 [Phycisphaerae bacterium]|nr:hypothetical protein [Phycisphaerae bacterium]